MSEGEKRKKAAPRIEKLRVTKKRPALMMGEKEAVKVGNPMVEGLEFGRALTGKNTRCYIMAKLKGRVKSHLVQVSAKEALNYEALTKTLKVESMKKSVSGVKFKELKAFAYTKKLELLPGVTFSFSPIYPKQVSTFLKDNLYRQE